MMNTMTSATHRVRGIPHRLRAASQAVVSRRAIRSHLVRGPCGPSPSVDRELPGSADEFRQLEAGPLGGVEVRFPLRRSCPTEARFAHPSSENSVLALFRRPSMRRASSAARTSPDAPAPVCVGRGTTRGERRRIADLRLAAVGIRRIAAERAGWENPFTEMPNGFDKQAW